MIETGKCIEMKKSDSHVQYPAIVVPAYRRPAHLKRLLNSVNHAHYPQDKVRLIISVDGGGDPEVLDAANQFKFGPGTKVIIERDRNMGLREHILELGDLTESYGSIILLEDDLIVSPSFYHFALTALQTYRREPEIAGISLYSQRYNETAQLPFLPLQTGFDAFFMQVPSSWGQAWSSDQWKLFRHWYASHQDKSLPEDGTIPQNVIDWPQSSWKKYFYWYMVQNQRWFVYPYTSYTTGGCDHQAEHMKRTGTRFQVPIELSENPKENYHLPDLSDRAPRYDGYMEINPAFFAKWLNAISSDIEMDLYSTKPLKLLHKKEFVVTPQCDVDGALQQFSLTYKPPEVNLMHELVEGETPFFVLTRSNQINRKKRNTSEVYVKFAQHLSGMQLDTRKFTKGFFRNILIKKILQKWG